MVCVSIWVIDTSSSLFISHSTCLFVLIRIMDMVKRYDFRQGNYWHFLLKYQVVFVNPSVWHSEAHIWPHGASWAMKVEPALPFYGSVLRIQYIYMYLFQCWVGFWVRSVFMLYFSTLVHAVVALRRTVCLTLEMFLVSTKLNRFCYGVTAWIFWMTMASTWSVQPQNVWRDLTSSAWWQRQRFFLPYRLAIFLEEIYNSICKKDIFKLLWRTLISMNSHFSYNFFGYR